MSKCGNPVDDQKKTIVEESTPKNRGVKNLTKLNGSLILSSLLLLVITALETLLFLLMKEMPLCAHVADWLVIRDLLMALRICFASFVVLFLTSRAIILLRDYNKHVIASLALLRPKRIKSIMCGAYYMIKTEIHGEMLHRRSANKNSDKFAEF